MNFYKSPPKPAEGDCRKTYESTQIITIKSNYNYFIPFKHCDPLNKHCDPFNIVIPANAGIQEHYD